MLYMMIISTVVTIYNLLLLVYIAQRIDRVNIRVDVLEFLIKLYNKVVSMFYYVNIKQRK
jgi:hypothetical protein